MINRGEKGVSRNDRRISHPYVIESTRGDNRANHQHAYSYQTFYQRNSGNGAGEAFTRYSSQDTVLFICSSRWPTDDRVAGSMDQSAAQEGRDGQGPATTQRQGHPAGQLTASSPTEYRRQGAG